MKRVTVLERAVWHGRHQTTECMELTNLTDMALQKRIEELNSGYRSNFWRVVKDFNLSRQADQYAYAAYCLSCAADRYHKDIVARERGQVQLARVLADLEKDE